ncbi:MAG: anaerobic sulfatase maturase [Actinobacteria bacterium]|nr:anaerobic sulfatase maturase [Actinomycetota bacterium]
MEANSTFNPPKVLNSVLVKPAGPDCNLHCTYCFYLQKEALFPEQKKHRMTEPILKEMVKQVMQQGGQNVNFGWQGGEPTLMGRPFFEKAVQYQQRFGRPGQTVGNGLQTNGILIDESFAKFLADAKFLVGLSLDGPEHVHNKYRMFIGDKPSWHRVVKARDALLNAGAEVNALIVVNDYSVNYAKEIYKYHKKNGLKFMQFIPCVEPDPTDPSKAAPYSVSAEAYGNFLIELFDLWVNDFRFGQPMTSVRWFDSVFYTYVGMQAPECTLLKECGIYLVVEHTGDVYSCDFYVEPKWHLGNVMQNNLSDLLNSPLQNQFGAVKSAMPKECYSCEWVSHCYGGCPKDRQKDARDNGSNHFCQSYKMFFSHADARLRKIADEWMIAQGIKKPNNAPPEEDDYVEVRPNDPCPCGSGKKFKNCCGKEI